MPAACPGVLAGAWPAPEAGGPVVNTLARAACVQMTATSLLSCQCSLPQSCVTSLACHKGQLRCRHGVRARPKGYAGAAVITLLTCHAYTETHACTTEGRVMNACCLAPAVTSRFAVVRAQGSCPVQSSFKHPTPWRKVVVRVVASCPPPPLRFQRGATSDRARVASTAAFRLPRGDQYMTALAKRASVPLPARSLLPLTAIMMTRRLSESQHAPRVFHAGCSAQTAMLKLYLGA